MIEFFIIAVFVLGYLGIIFENISSLNKAATALLMAAFCWLIYFIGAQYVPQFASATSDTRHILGEYLADTAQIVFFLLAVMTIVELIDAHHGFKLVTDMIYSSSKRKTLWFILLISFFLSSVLDNLTTMIVMISLLKKIIPQKKDRWFLGGIIVISVNAGGAWTPIGDVTTTMLWINGNITTLQVMKFLFLPSLVCMVVAGLIAMFFIKGENQEQTEFHLQEMEPGAKTVFFGGLLALVAIPVWKALFDFPPFMGALIGLGVLWFITDLKHYPYDRTHLRVPHMLSKIDTSGVLFFLGILLAVNALTAAGILKNLALSLETMIPNHSVIAILIGLLSSIIDNVPLVAATMGMYPLSQFPTDSSLWQLIAYAAGTGGSILIIGSAAGVAFMGIEKVDFFWYFKRIAWIALISYFAGAAVYFLTYPLLV